MRIAYAVFILAILTPVACTPQSPADPAPASGVAPAPSALSGALQPALDTVGQTVDGLNLERWKKGTIRDDATKNAGAIQRDLKDHLPPLLHEADAAPGSVSKVLPVSQNIDALYDVLLRVVEAAQVAAPGDQVDRLQNALASLGKARLALVDRMQGSAVVLEKQVADLHSALEQSARQAAARSAAVATPGPVTTPCTAPARRIAKRKPPAKPAQKPAQTPPAKPTPTSSSNSNSSTGK